MNKITALSLLKITENPSHKIIVIADNTLVIDSVVKALKEIGWKHQISGYTKDRLVLKTGGELNVILKMSLGDRIRGCNPNLILYQGSFNDLSMEEKTLLSPILMSSHSPVIKKITEELDEKVPKQWLGGEFGQLIFTEYN